MCIRVVIGTREDVEEARRIVRGLSHTIECAVIGQNFHINGKDLAFLGCRDGGSHVVIAGK